jgi:uncharacterized protein
MAELLTTYSSLRLQTVDACVIVLAERLDLHEVSALDRRDFQVVAAASVPRLDSHLMYVRLPRSSL